MAEVWTIGYQGYGPEAWIARLLDEGIAVVVDVRELPRSRRAGFSKRVLAERLEASGVSYVGVRELGVPPELRIPLREGRLPFREFAPAFRRLLQGRTPEIDEAIRIARGRRAVLLCWEEDPHRCHRSLVAEAMRERLALSTPPEGLRIVHLRRDGSAEEA